MLVNSYLHAGDVDAETCAISDELADVVLILHGELYTGPRLSPVTLGPTPLSCADCLLTLSDQAPKLQNKISLLCEDWWRRGLRYREEVVPNTVLYLLARALAQGAKVHVFVVAVVCVKRVVCWDDFYWSRGRARGCWLLDCLGE